MNTEPEQPPQPLLPPQQPNDFGALEKTVVRTKLDEAAVSLEERLQQEIDLRREERFAWIFGVTLLMDALVFPALSWASIPVFLLELIFLTYMAKWLGVDVVVVMLERVFNKYVSTGKKDN